MLSFIKIKKKKFIFAVLFIFITCLNSNFCVFAAATSTFIRFFPQIKARYDYGLLIFILTFSLISVSGLRDDEILELAHKRLATIFIGGSACVIISIVVCPVWAGEDLHNLIAANIENLGSFLEGIFPNSLL